MVGRGLVLSQQRAIIERRPAGRYVSVWKAEYPGNPALQALHPDDPDWVASFAPFEASVVMEVDVDP